MASAADGLDVTTTNATTGLNSTATGAGNSTVIDWPAIEITPHAATLAQAFVGVTAVLMALCTFSFVTRIYQRVVPVWKVGLDDYFIVIGFILTCTNWAMLFPTMILQPGEISWDRSMYAMKNSWLAIGIWGLSMTAIKISIALTLLRIQGKKLGWRIFLYSIIAIQTVYGVGNVLFNTAICCRPLRAAWDFSLILSGEGKCVSYEVQRAVSNIGSAINITTDVLLSFAPATFLRKLNRPLRERIFVCVLMGMGILASVSSIIKTIEIQNYGKDAEVSWAYSVRLCTWTALEQHLSLLAACVPAIKGILQRCLTAMGVNITQTGSRAARSGYYIHDRSTNGVTMASRDRIGTLSRTQKGGVETKTYSRKDKDEYDDETCIDLPDMSRNGSTKSLGMRSSDMRSSDNGRDSPRDHSVEHFPAHAV